MPEADIRVPAERGSAPHSPRVHPGRHAALLRVLGRVVAVIAVLIVASLVSMGLMHNLTGGFLSAIVFGDLLLATGAVLVRGILTNDEVSPR
jgi:NhaP-type Na+/H+ or K+/H+ antiporter